MTTSVSVTVNGETELPTLKTPRFSTRRTNESLYAATKDRTHICLSDFEPNSEYLSNKQSQWSLIIGNTDTSTMQSQSAQFEQCIVYTRRKSFWYQRSVHECACAIRAVFWHHLYYRWNIAHQQYGKKHSLSKSKSCWNSKNDVLSIYDIIQYFKNYSLLQLIDDCEHVDSAHRDDIPEQCTPVSSKTSSVSNSPINKSNSNNKMVLSLNTTSFHFLSSSNNSSPKIGKRQKRKNVRRRAHSASPNAKRSKSEYYLKKKLEEQEKELVRVKFQLNCQQRYEKVHKNYINKYRAIVRFFRKYCSKCISGESCPLFKRNRRDINDDGILSIRRRIYYGIEHSLTVCCMNKLDSFHTLWFHSTIRKKKYRKQTFYRHKRSFTTNVNLNRNTRKVSYDDITDDENESNNRGSKFVTTLKRSHSNKLIDGLLHSPNMSSPMSSISNSDKILLLRKISTQEQIVGAYQFGENFEYWPAYREYYNYIDAKWKTLKEELLNNTIYKIEIQIWIHTKTNANQELLSAKGRKQLIAQKNFYNNITGIEFGQSISVRHLCTVLLYTNHTTMQEQFKKTMRMPSNIQQIEVAYDLLKSQNAQIAIWCKLLFESVHLFGTIMTCDQLFYHGISRRLLFEKFYAAFNCPISTTTEISVAKNFRQSLKGIILCVSCQSNQALISYLDVSWLSNFRGESERLFYGAHLRIIDIEWRHHHLEYYLRSLTLFLRITNGNLYAHDKFMMGIGNQKRLVKLIKSHMNRFVQKPMNKVKVSMVWLDEEDYDTNEESNDDEKLPETQTKLGHRKSSSLPLEFDGHERKNQAMHSSFRKTAAKKYVLNKMMRKRNSNKKKKNKKGKHIRIISSESSFNNLEVVHEKVSLIPSVVETEEKQSELLYFDELFDYCVSVRKNGIIFLIFNAFVYLFITGVVWLCASQLLSLEPELRELFCKNIPVQPIYDSPIDDSFASEAILGKYLEYWRTEYNVTVEDTFYYNWRIDHGQFDEMINGWSGELISSPYYDYLIPSMLFPQKMSTASSRLKQKSLIIANSIASEDDESKYAQDSDSYKIVFYAECGRSKDDPKCMAFFWNVHQIENGIREIEVVIDVLCRQANFYDSHQPNWMSRPPKNDEVKSDENFAVTNNSYFGGKVFTLERKFFASDVQNNMNEENKIRSYSVDLDITAKKQFVWNISVRVTNVIFEEERIIELQAESVVI